MRDRVTRGTRRTSRAAGSCAASAGSRDHVVGGGGRPEPEPAHLREAPVARDQEHGRALEEPDDEQVERGGDAQREREPTDRARPPSGTGPRAAITVTMSAATIVRNARLNAGCTAERARLARRAPRPSVARRTRCRSRRSRRARSRDRPRRRASARTRPSARDDDQRERQDAPRWSCRPRRRSEQPVVEEEIQRRAGRARRGRR